MKRPSVALMAAAAIILSAHAQLFNFRNFGPSRSTEVTGTAHMEPQEVVVGEPCAIVLELEVEDGVGLEDLQLGGLPDADAPGKVVYADGVENLSDRKSAKEGHTVKRLALKARFLEPCVQEVAVVVHGMVATRRRQGGMSFTSSSSFRTRLQPFVLRVAPLPSEGRPSTFAGAVGSRFKMTQKLSPDHVHPGDLVTATYVLSFDGYCPSNLWPNIEGLSKSFKAYEPKEVSRAPGRIVWTQVLVPQTAEATNSAEVSISCYDVRAKRYELIKAPAQRLVFVSDEAASTENTAVIVTADKPMPEYGESPSGNGTAGPLTLRIAPSDSSPVVTTLPPGTPVTERGRLNGWRRLESPQGIGWTR